MNPNNDKRILPDYSKDLVGLDVSRKVKKHLNLMIIALTNVNKDYMWYNHINIPEIKCEHVERVFAYEFYYQWRKILESIGCSLFLNSEISKKVIEDIENKKSGVLFPDIVLHGGQANVDKRFQLIACEIKRSEGITKEKVKGDIVSLKDYISKEHFTNNPFQCGVFIIVGTDLKQSIGKPNIINEIKKIEGIDMISQKILCVAYDFNDKVENYHLEIKTLHNIINNLNS